MDNGGILYFTVIPMNIFHYLAQFAPVTAVTECLKRNFGHPAQAADKADAKLGNCNDATIRLDAALADTRLKFEAIMACLDRIENKVDMLPKA